MLHVILSMYEISAKEEGGLIIYHGLIIRIL